MRRALRIAALCALGLAVSLLGIWLLIPEPDRPEPGEILAYLESKSYIPSA